MPILEGDYTTTDEGSYTEYTVSSNSKMFVQMEEGGDFSDALIDVSASGAGVQFFTYPDRYAVDNPINSCSIRNVGINGSLPTDNGFVFLCGVSGDAVIENVYLGDGEYGSGPHDGPGAFFGMENHTGSMDIRSVYLSGFSDNGFYMPGRPGNRVGSLDGSGSYHFYDCYVTNCEISAYRIDDQPNTSSMENCHCDLTGTTGRGIWNWESTMNVEDCHLVGGANGGIVGDGHCSLSGDVQVSGGVSTSTSGSYGTNPDPWIPSDCPQGAYEAAEGTSDSDPGGGTGGGDTSYDNTLFISGEERTTPGTVEYTLRTTGKMTMGEYRDPEFSQGDVSDQGDYHEVTWQISDWRDSWDYNGELFYVDCNNDQVRFEVNGSQIDKDADQYSRSEPPEKDDPDDGGGGQEPNQYPSGQVPDRSQQITIPSGDTRTLEFVIDTE